MRVGDEVSYPNLTLLIEEIGMDQGYHPFPKPWKEWPEDSEALEDHASLLDEESLIGLATGGEEERHAALQYLRGKEKHASCLTKKLDEFLDQVYDGDWTKIFFDFHNL